MEWLIILFLVLILVGATPHWGYSRGWGYGPSGLIGLLLILLVVWILFGGESLPRFR